MKILMRRSIATELHNLCVMSRATVQTRYIKSLSTITFRMKWISDVNSLDTYTHTCGLIENSCKREMFVNRYFLFLLSSFFFYFPRHSLSTIDFWLRMEFLINILPSPRYSRNEKFDNVIISYVKFHFENVKQQTKEFSSFNKKNIPSNFEN